MNQFTLEINIKPSVRNVLLKLADTVGGARPMIVGGAVRDAVFSWIRGTKEANDVDVDIEVFGVEQPTLLKFLEENFESVTVNGTHFGVITVMSEETGKLDFSLPRTERSIGHKHTEFETSVNPHMSFEEASKRRDFTMNALMWDVTSNTVFDFWDGVRDMKDGVLRVVDPEQFVDDPLRVLRAMQFTSRFNLREDMELFAIARTMVHMFDSLPQERIREEWIKWAKAPHPANGLWFLMESNWLQCFPELDALVRIPQDDAWHPEGDVWMHTIETVNAMRALIDEHGINEDEHVLQLMFGALAHDMGKATTTQLVDGRWRAPGHDVAGIEPAKKFGNRLFKGNGQKRTPTIVQGMMDAAEFHMRQFTNDTRVKALRRLSNDLRTLTVEDLCLIIVADASGRPFTGEFLTPTTVHIIEKLSEESGDELLTEKPEPILMGRHLLEHFPQIKHGPQFGNILRQAFDAQLDGVFETVEEAIEWVKQNIVVEEKTKQFPIRAHIRAENIRRVDISRPVDDEEKDT